MSIDRDFIRITGRRLQQPTIEYGADGCQSIPVHPNDGSWTMPRDAGYHFPGERKSDFNEWKSAVEQLAYEVSSEQLVTRYRK